MNRMLTLTFFIGLPSILLAQNVGLGTSAPAYRLHVVSTSTYVAQFENTSNTSSEVIFRNSLGNGAYVGLYSDDFEIYTLGGRDIHFGTSGSNRLNITSTGNIGIGTATPTERLTIQSGNLLINSGNIDLSSSTMGVILNSADRPLITRGFDAFTSGNYNGIGRWGLFMEPSRLTLGIPNLSGKAVEIARYELNSSRTTLLTVNEEGKMRRPGSNNQDLLPVAMGNISYSGGIWGGTGNFTVEHPSTGNYYITFNGISYNEHQYIVIATMNQVINTLAFAYSTQVSGGRLGILVKAPNGNGVDQDFHFVMYKL